MAKKKDTQEMFLDIANEADVSNSDLFKSQAKIKPIENKFKYPKTEKFINNWLSDKRIFTNRIDDEESVKEAFNFLNLDPEKLGITSQTGGNDLVYYDHEYFDMDLKRIKKNNPSYKQKNDGIKNPLIKQTILSFPYIQYFEGHPNSDQIATEYLKYIKAIKQNKFTPNVLEAIQNDLKSVFDNRTYGQDKQKDYDLLKIGLKVLSKYQRMIV